MATQQPNLQGVGPVLFDGGSAPVSLTGSTSEVELGRIILPPYPLGTAGLLQLMAQFSTTNNANAKTVRVRSTSLAGTILASGNISGNGGATFGTLIGVRPAGILGSGLASSFFGLNAALASVALDWSVNNPILITGQLAVGTDTLTLEHSFWLGFKY